MSACLEGTHDDVRGTKPAVIIIDALNECDNKDLMAEFIGVVIGSFKATCQLPFQIVFTSRVEENIHQKLDTADCLVVHHLSLESFDACCDLYRFIHIREP